MPPDISPCNMLSVGVITLSLLERHNLEVGKLPTSLLSQQLWLLRRGEGAFRPKAHWEHLRSLPVTKEHTRQATTGLWSQQI